MSRRPVLGLLALTALAAVATAFVGAGEGVSSDRRVVVVPPGAPVQIAFVGDDDVPAYTVSFEDAVRMAIAAHPSIDGHPVQIVDFHSTCNVPSASEDVARAVVADTQVVAVIGHLCSSGMRAALPTYERAGIVTVNGSTTVAGVLPALGPTVFNRLVVQEPDANGWYAAVQALPSDQAWPAAYAAVRAPASDLRRSLLRLDQPAASEARPGRSANHHGRGEGRRRPARPRRPEYAGLSGRFL
jgi:hypothetical protein